MNRIEAHAAKVRATIAAGGKNGALDTPEKIAQFERAQAITFSEHHQFQNAQAAAFAMGKLTQEEATMVYRALGEGFTESNGGWSEGADLAMKVTVWALMGQLIGR